MRNPNAKHISFRRSFPLLGGRVGCDIDHVLERRGKFLFIDYKAKNERLPSGGTLIMYRQLAKLAKCTVMFVFVDTADDDSGHRLVTQVYRYIVLDAKGGYIETPCDLAQYEELLYTFAYAETSDSAADVSDTQVNSETIGAEANPNLSSREPLYTPWLARD